MTTPHDPADQQRRLRRLRTLAERNGYQVHKNTLRTGHTAGKFMLTSQAGDYGFIFHAMTLDQAERWVQTVPADDAGKLNHLFDQFVVSVRVLVCLDVDRIIDFYESGLIERIIADIETPLAALDEHIALAEQDNTDAIG